MAFDYDRLESLAQEVLVAIGEDPGREGLKDTPRRWASFWKEFIEYDPGNCDTTFEAVTSDQMVVVKGMRVWSLCEHHLLPFWCDVSIGYISWNKILGLSKFGRIAHEAAHRLQLQERLVQQIADKVEELTSGHDVAVVAQGVHTCMVMRGVKTPAVMVSSILRGAFRENPACRAEFMQIIYGGSNGLA